MCNLTKTQQISRRCVREIEREQVREGESEIV